MISTVNNLHRTLSLISTITHSSVSAFGDNLIMKKKMYYEWLERGSSGGGSGSMSGSSQGWSNEQSWTPESAGGWSPDQSFLHHEQGGVGGQGEQVHDQRGEGGQAGHPRGLEGQVPARGEQGGHRPGPGSQHGLAQGQGAHRPQGARQEQGQERGGFGGARPKERGAAVCGEGQGHAYSFEQDGGFAPVCTSTPNPTPNQTTEIPKDEIPKDEIPKDEDRKEEKMKKIERGGKGRGSGRGSGRKDKEEYEKIRRTLTRIKIDQKTFEIEQETWERKEKKDQKNKQKKKK